MTTLKVIKKKDFDTNGTKGTAFTCAFKGRVLNVSTLSFTDEDKDCLKHDDKANTLVINCNIEIVKKPYIDALGEVVNGLSVLPAFGLALSEV